ncbi:hypothetical protein O6H91_12G095000 [Diphasiastrum complanatum]|uniref:Uncharacterized protein n=5 Tax=Diphasiastrum complanatum TaxID=34168 RepID=A0ACC2C4T6_DIPCM|nr:hypothetical protein O6H91_12G095000 [Diphasiastrum complanatum]KAJ7537053.1 hypothetical protein O6H91_12G095000 [Diphasiastrum complanatum]KAJ7537054.1 hypothetical protein O6H91_12G095000 [Diphasiastrum complanatum]KAJ7537059.1 hypothetical protein O6H91_12G095000 [Diphasiastrum complanatum]
MATSDGSQPPSRLTRQPTIVVDEFLDSQVVPSSLASIAPILRAANEIEAERPRVAYLCRLHAFEKAHRMDPHSNGRGVRQFKTALFQRLERDDEETKKKRIKRDDAQEIQDFYQIYYDKYVKDLEKAPGDRAQLAKAYQTAGVLFEVLLVVNKNIGVDKEIMSTGKEVEQKKEIFVPYNILPLDSAGASQEIMQLDEIKAAMEALRNIRGLPFQQSNDQPDHNTGEQDVLDWLKETFGFQKGNVANQREHLILLLANVQVALVPAPNPLDKLDDRAINKVMHRLFKNYKVWCQFLDRPPSLKLPTVVSDVQQRKILYMALYLLIWGEAANLRFMPECLCYIYHYMAQEVTLVLSGTISTVTGESIRLLYDSGFLTKVVIPIYEIIRKEAESNKNGTAPHSSWRNYDDLNEYFWSAKCFQLEWPMKRAGDFFKPRVEKGLSRSSKDKRVRHLNKTGFVEIRSFWHLYRSFDRMWIFLILSLQAMIVIAWSESESPPATFDDVFKRVLSIFITAAGLHFLQAVLDIIFNIKAYHSLNFLFIMRLLLKMLVALSWIIILSVCYVNTRKKPTTWTIGKWFSSNGKSPSLYAMAVMIYLVPNMLGAAFFMFPNLRRWAENSDRRAIRLFLWWSQIKPLVEPTKNIMAYKNIQWKWHEFFPHAKKNIGAVVSLWAPVILVYFMDSQIWYAVYSTLSGGVTGAFMRLGEIRSLGMLRSRFRSLPTSFNKRMVACSKPVRRNYFFGHKADMVDPDSQKMQATKFAQVWNEIISSFREEDLISDKERDLMLVPYATNSYVSAVQWPPFLLASKAPMAVQMAAEFNARDSEKIDAELWRKIQPDEYMRSAVEECYESMKKVLDRIIQGEAEKKIIFDGLFSVVDKHIQEGSLLANFRMTALPTLCEQFVDLIKRLVKEDSAEHDRVILLLQDMFEVVTHDMMTDEARRTLESSCGPLARTQSKDRQLFATIEPTAAVLFPPPKDEAWSEQLKRLLLLLTVKEAAMDVPTNLEARRRIAFFTNSLFMDMPPAPLVRNMLSFSVLTPYYDEDVIFTKSQLYEENEDGISILFYLQKIYPDEWNNFLERVDCDSENTVRETKEEELRSWASYRGQTLSRTVRGMMYYRRALELQAFLDMAKDIVLKRGYKVTNTRKKELDDERKAISTRNEVANPPEPDQERKALLAKTEDDEERRALLAKMKAVADLKFSYVATCQIYGVHQLQNNQRATDIKYLMQSYPSLRVAYIDEVEERDEAGKLKKAYYSVLVKVVDKESQEIYRIKLPGPVKIGEGKPENQNHAIIFTRGEALQTIDMNQDNYLEETVKMRNLLEEFNADHGVRRPSILGVREHIFTGSVSSLAWFMSNQEMSFVTIGQRVLADPLKVRFHYGHPDVFDRLFHITRGGISKASKVINLSEDIFAGFNSTLRRGNVTHHEYIQVGKGRDVGLNQISLFEAKVANGNGEQTLSRDIYRLGHRFDFFRMMSCYVTTIGFYFNTMLVVLTVYVFLYGRLYMALSGLEKSLLNQAKLKKDLSLQAALASQSLVQLGLLMALPMVMEIGLERGFRTALSDLIVMQLQLASVFFTFSLGTKTHFYGRTILHGGAKYRPTGRGFVVRHEKFAENYRLYSRSHFTKGFEIAILLIVYNVYGIAHSHAIPYLLITFSMWFLVGTWLFAPFLFNPSGFEWQKIVEDWEDWNKWIYSKGRIGVPANKSWESWWEVEQEHLKYTGVRGRILEILLSMRFFIYQYGLVYHLHITHHHKSLSIYGLSWLVIVAVLGIVKTISAGRQRFKKDLQLMFRLLKGLLFIGFVAIIILLFRFANLTVGDLFVSILAFMPTGWGLLQIAQASRPLVEKIRMWDSVRALSRTYEFIMGMLLFTPVSILAWFPFVSEFQTRLLFNQAFSRGLQISRILAGKKRKVRED